MRLYLCEILAVRTLTPTFSYFDMLGLMMPGFLVFFFKFLISLYKVIGFCVLEMDLFLICRDLFIFNSFYTSKSLQNFHAWSPGHLQVYRISASDAGPEPLLLLLSFFVYTFGVLLQSCAFIAVSHFDNLLLLKWKTNK